MCTVSWLHEEDGYHLLCNRDEKRTRLTARAPRQEQWDGVAALAPRDGDAGGTWIGVNELGVSVCLLNGASLQETTAAAARRPQPESRESRGRLVLELISSRRAMEVCERLWRLDLAPFAPFTVAVLEPGEPAAVIEWDGEAKSILPFGDPFAPLVSSSYDGGGVRRARLREYDRVSGAAPSAAQLCRFHESHASHASAYSPCMHRSDAATVSFSWVTVRDDSIEFFYAPGAPCEWKPGETARLRRLP